MSFVNFLRTGRRGKKKDAEKANAVRCEGHHPRTTRVERFEHRWGDVEGMLINLKLQWQQYQEEGGYFDLASSRDTVLETVCAKMDEVIRILFEERQETKVEAPPCYELLLKCDVVSYLSRFSKENLGCALNINSSLVYVIADIILFVPGSRDRPLIGYYKHTTEAILDLLKHLQPRLSMSLVGDAHELALLPTIDGKDHTEDNLNNSVHRPQIDQFGHLSTSASDSTLHHSFLYLMYSLAYQLVSYPTCSDFFFSEDSSLILLEATLPYIGSEQYVYSETVLCRTSETGKQLFLSDLAVEIIECLCCVWNERVARCLDHMTDFIVGMVITEFRGLLDEVLCVKTEHQRGQLCDRLAVRLCFCNKVAVGASLQLQDELLSNYKQAICMKLTEVIQCSPQAAAGSLILSFILRELQPGPFLQASADIVLKNTSCLNALVALAEGKPSPCVTASIGLLTMLLRKIPEEAHELLVARYLPSDPSVYREGANMRKKINELFHPLAMRSEDVDDADSRIDAASSILPQHQAGDKWRSVCAGEDYAGGIMDVVVDKLRNAESLPVPVNVSVVGFLTQMLLCEARSSTLYFFWADGPIMRALSAVKSNVEKWYRHNGEVQTREHAQRARKTLGILRNDDVMLTQKIVKKRSFKRKSSFQLKVLDARETRAFEAWVTLDEWRVELLALIRAIDDAALIRNMGATNFSPLPSPVVPVKATIPPSIITPPTSGSGGWFSSKPRLG